MIPPLIEIQPGVFRYRFNASSWLADSRLDWPDLTVTSATLTIDQALPVPAALVTVTVLNSGTLATGAPVYLNLYDRLAPAPVPTGPLDLTDGWCGEGVFPDLSVSGLFHQPRDAWAGRVNHVECQRPVNPLRPAPIPFTDRCVRRPGWPQC